MRCFIFSFFLITGLSSSVTAQSVIDTSNSLPEIEIKVERSIFNQRNFSSSVVNLEEIILPNYSINEALNRVNGIFTTSPNNFAQDSRISVRGFGARSAFGIRGVRILTDGFPETSPDGQSQLDNVDFNSIKSIEFLRGPQSGLYGNNSGGVLHLRSFDFYEDNSIKLGYTYGSFGLNTLKLGSVQGSNKIKFKLNINHTDYKGYRTWSDFQNTIINTNTQYRNGQNEIHLLLNYVTSPLGNDPGGVNLTELTEGRYLARPANETFKAGETVDQFKAGVAYKLKNKENKEKLNLRIFGIDRSFSNYLPFENSGAVSIDRILYGTSLDYITRYNLKSIKIGHTFGLDYDYQNDLRVQYQNLKGARGDEKFNQNEKFNSKAYFILNEVHFSPRWWASANFRYDHIITEAKDNFLSNGDQSGKISNGALNYTIAINFKDKLHQYSLIRSTGFEIPTLSELSNNPAGIGGFSSTLLPMSSSNLELNMSSSKYKWGSYQTNIYSIKTKNEIVGYEIAGQSGRTFFRNQGNTTRTGIEANVNIHPLKYFNLTILQNYILAQYSEGSTNNGKLLPGIPKNITHMSLDYAAKRKWHTQIDFRHVSSIYLDDLNTVNSQSYQEINIRFKKELKLNKLMLEAIFGINNLFNSEYYSNIRINAVAARYYEAAMPRNYYTTFFIKI